MLEKAFAVGVGGIVGQNVRLALSGLPAPRSTTSSPASAAGRSPRRRCTRLLADALADRLGPLTFLDLDLELVERELRSARATARPGPHAENMLRDIGIVAAGPV